MRRVHHESFVDGGIALALGFDREALRLCRPRRMIVTLRAGPACERA